MRIRATQTNTVWVNFACPYCGGRKETYGIAFRGGRQVAAKCWKCDSRKVDPTLLREAQEAVDAVPESELLIDNPDNARGDLCGFVLRKNPSTDCVSLLKAQALRRWPGLSPDAIDEWFRYDDDTPYSVFFVGGNDRGNAVQERRIYAEIGPKAISQGASGAIQLLPIAERLLGPFHYKDHTQPVVIGEGAPAAIATALRWGGANHVVFNETNWPRVVSLQGATNDPFRDLASWFRVSGEHFVLGVDNDFSGKNCGLRIGAELLNRGNTLTIYRPSVPGWDPADVPYGQHLEPFRVYTMADLLTALDFTYDA